MGGVLYSLSKRTTLYVDASQVDNKGVGKTSQWATAWKPVTAGGNSTGFEAGIRHTFWVNPCHSLHECGADARSRTSSIHSGPPRQPGGFYLLPTGSSPVLAMTGAALAEVKNLMSARAASRLPSAPVTMPAERTLPLHFVGQRADVVDTGDRHQFAHLLQPQLGVATRDHGAYRSLRMRLLFGST